MASRKALTNGQIAELLAREAESARMPAQKALRRASRRAFLAPPKGSGPGFRRPVLVVQSDSFNRGSIATVLCVPLTSKAKWAFMPGNIHLSTHSTGLPKNSVANVSQLIAIDKALLVERVGRLPQSKLDLVFAGIELVLARKG